MKNLSSQTLIVGLGKTGLSCARYLAAQGESFVVTDSRAQPPGLDELVNEYPETPVHVGGFREKDFSAANRLVLSPGVSLRDEHVASAMSRGAEVLGDIELFARSVTAPVIAITGTNGKSTVTTLVAEMAKAAGSKVRVGGNLGMPALELLDSEDTDLYVLELSSFQLETTHSLDAVAAVVLNITPDHMDRYDSVEHYSNTKATIYRGTGIMVINSDDVVVSKMMDSQRQVIKFSLQQPSAGEFGVITESNTQWLAFGENKLLATTELKIPGSHNQSNALAALALGHAVGLDMASMIETLKGFTGLAHRSEWVAEQDGVRWFNDSKATNVGATVAALQGMPGPLILIAGGDGKAADFSELHDVIASETRDVILLGRDADSIEKVINGAVPVHRATDMQDAVGIANKIAISGDSVLLSPACASFDMYKNYIERGDDFVQAVKQEVAHG
ncbi:MAG: UDP-N-acetylmuramoyl-L-alanine--D-glutamate ligase [Sulfuriflexus sp.]|nr:UDP-N-acetylmuramoyl-L-alanine--D-glutamate ligase [Sulfuriflexus sp.]